MVAQPLYAGNLSFESTGIQRGVNRGRVNALIDINRDGHIDWIRSQRNEIAIDLGDGKGGFTENAVIIPMTEGYKFEHTVIPADIDGDGRIELLVEWGRYDFPKGKCRVLHDDGSLHFSNVTEQCGLYEDGLSIKGIGDFDQDGDTDIIALEQMKEFSIFLNDGKGRFTKKAGAITGIEGEPHYASWGLAATVDLDNDGVPDILVNGKNFLKVLRGTGGGSFVCMNKAWGIEDYSSATVDDGLCFGDIDGDGRPRHRELHGEGHHQAERHAHADHLPQRHAEAQLDQRPPRRSARQRRRIGREDHGARARHRKARRLRAGGVLQPPVVPVLLWPRDHGASRGARRSQGRGRGGRVLPLGKVVKAASVASGGAVTVHEESAR